MGIDAVALLRIENLASPPGALGGGHPVQHRGNASRRVLGSALDAHADPRGMLFFPSICEPRANSYDAIVREVESAGVWAPNVALDHVPARFTAAPSVSHEALVARMVERLGRDAGTRRSMDPEFASVYEQSLRNKKR